MNDPLRLWRHRFGTLVFLLAPAAVWVGCSTATVSEPASVYHTMNQRFALSLRERAHLRAKAWDGDGEAAYRLHEYFVYIKRDRALGRYWCRVAAKHDNASGLLGMVFYLHEDPSLGKPGEIDSWFKRAYAVVQEEHALEYLRDMELSVKEQSADP